MTHISCVRGALILACAATFSVRAQSLETDGGAGEVSGQPVLVSESVIAVPARAALINRRHELVGDWVELDGTSIQEDCGASLCFDQIETNGEDSQTSRLGDGYYGQDCGVGGSRWFLGRNYCNTLFADDVDMLPECEGITIGRIQHAWWWQAGGTGTRERCFIEFSFYEDFNDCDGGARFIGGIVVDFGELDSSQGNGFYYADIPLCYLPLERLKSPADGAGVYRGAYYKRYVSGQDFEFATCAQPMLWTLRKPLNWSFSTWRQFDDIHPRDGVLDWPNECSDYDSGVCGSPLGAATSFFRKGTRNGQNQITPKLRLDCLSGQKIIARVKNLEPGAVLSYELNGVVVKTQTGNRQGKDRATLTVVRRFPNTVRIPEYFLMRNQKCE